MLRSTPRIWRSFVRLVVFTLAIGLFGGRARALTVTQVTSDNGYPAHKVTWTDSAGLPRTAILVDQNATASGPYTGYLRQYTYQVNGQTRVCTGTENPAAGGDLEFSGDGFVQNHTADGGDFSTGNGNGTPGTTTVTLQGTSHAIITYNIPAYQISGETVPTTVQWFFADGRSHPIFAISQDSRANPGDLGADSRSPYGDMAYDGGVDALVGGFSYGDTYKLVTLASAPEEVTQSSGWQATQANTIPYAMQWAEPATVDAEMGHVATLPISLSDQGIDTQTSIYDNPPDLFDPRTMNVPNGPLPPANTWAFQIINYSLPASGPTDSKRLAWGANFGRVGGFDNYGDTSLDNTQYSQHSTDPINQPLAGVRAPGGLMAYSTFIVLGTHTGGYLDGTVGQTVTQMENATLATLTATTGTTVASGPAGVGNAANANIMYVPAGYNPTYSAWEVHASANAVNATLTPASGASLDHPVFVVDGYTSARLPQSIAVNGQSTAGTNFYATVDPAGQRLWITVNELASSAVNLVVVAPLPLAQTITFPAIPSHLATDAPFAVNATASSGLPVSFSIVSGPATVSGATITLTGQPGTVLVEADQAGNAAYTAAPSVRQSFAVTTPSVAPKAQTITFAAIPNQVTTDAPFPINATASSGLPVRFSIVSGPATVAGDTITLTGQPGTVLVEADQAGNGAYTAAPAARQSFTVTTPSVAQKEQTITFAVIPNQVTTNAPFTINATASSGLPVRFSIVSGPAMVAGDTITLTKTVGAVVVEADQAGNASFSAAPAVRRTFMVTSPSTLPQAQTITFAAIVSHLTTSAPFVLHATASSGLPVSFSIVSGPARVAGDMITLTSKAGTVVVEAAQAGNASYTAAPTVRRSFLVSLPTRAEKPVITSGTSEAAKANRPFSYQITASNEPTQYTATGLPAGLHVNGLTGEISGTSTTPGTFTVQLSASNAVGTGASTLSLKLVPALPLATLVADMPSVLAGSGGIGQFVVTLSAPRKEDVILKFAIRGTAIDGTDYVLLKTTRTIKAGKKTMQIDITPVGELAGAEKKVVALALVPGTGYVLGTPRSAKVTILAP